MSRRRNKLELPRKRTRNVSRPTSSFVDQLRAAGFRARLVANQPTNSRSFRHIKATLAQQQEFAEMELGLGSRLIRWLIALVLLPVCLITTYTFVTVLSHEELHQSFWRSEKFLFFGIGSAVMIALLSMGFFRRAFLYLYVLGHEFTHACFVFLYRGQVTDIKVSPEGGYIATNKSNILISLSPYFVPIWCITGIAIYGFLSWSISLPWYSNMLLYSWIGLSWSFHLWWTIWMIPRDQPDLKENDTFFSLVFIYLSNIFVLLTMICIASGTFLIGAFFAAWWIHAEELVRFCISLSSR
ncbi:MAG: hypothetical protein ACOVRB_11010 [Akkermansiaceae bacterium]